MLATLDHLAPGRLICGAGVGWIREEIELHGAPFARRGAWSDEATREMRTCWTEERAAFAGEFFRCDPVGARPHPTFFFFSSRRRHTRWNCDWSSDVCSSDLLIERN